jgi:hypothetical protein
MHSWTLPPFQLAVGLGGLLRGHGLVRAQPEPPIGQQGDRLIQGTGSTIGSRRYPEGRGRCGALADAGGGGKAGLAGREYRFAAQCC